MYVEEQTHESRWRLREDSTGHRRTSVFRTMPKVSAAVLAAGLALALAHVPNSRAAAPQVAGFQVAPDGFASAHNNKILKTLDINLQKINQ